MAIFDFFLSRNNAASTPQNYIGHKDRLFYNSADGVIKRSDGVTPGGWPIPITIATTEIAGSIIPGPGFTVGPTGVLGLNAGPSFYLDETDTFRLRPGSADLIGGIKAGPGIVIDSEGTLFIDSEGLEFSFGDFSATVGEYTDEEEYALLSSIKADEDVVIASNGTGTVCIIGELHVHKTNGDITGSLEDDPSFVVKSDGQVEIFVTQLDAQQGALELIGSETGESIAPGIDGAMLHITGQRDNPCRLYFDGNGNYVSLVARRWNGDFTDGRTQVLADDYVLRINATAQTDAGMGNVAMAQIGIQALENQTTTTQGSSISFTVTPTGAAATSRVDVAKITVADGVAATKFTGPLFGNVVATTVTATNLIGALSPATQLGITEVGTLSSLVVSGTSTFATTIQGTITTATLAGSVVNALTAGTYLTSNGTYNGGTARTFAVDATTAATASKVVARDANADVYARRFVGKQIHAVRDAGNPGGTLTLDFATDEIVVATLTADVTLAYSNLLAGSEVTLILQKTGGGTDQVNVALNEINIAPPSLPGTDNNFDFAQGECCIIRFISVGTTTGDLFASVVYDSF